MAVIQPVRVDDVHRATITWANITTADTGGAIDIRDLEDFKGIQVVGGGTAVFQVSNDGTNFAPTGAALASNSFNAPTLPTKFVSVGTVATATVSVVLVAQRRL